MIVGAPAHTKNIEGRQRMSIKDILVAMTSYPMRTDDPGATFLRHVPVEGDEEKRPDPRGPIVSSGAGAQA